MADDTRPSKAGFEAMNDDKDQKAAVEPPPAWRVSCAFETGDIVRVEKETYHGKPAGTLAEVLGVNELGWPRIKYNPRNIETLPPDFLVLVCQAKARSS